MNFVLKKGDSSGIIFSWLPLSVTMGVDGHSLQVSECYLLRPTDCAFIGQGGHY